MNYESIKRMAGDAGLRASDLIVLAPQNDPFYVGTKGDLAQARWFAALWQRFGYSTGVHLRRVHYQIVSQSPAVKMNNGLPYENTEKCWDTLGMAAKAARYLGLVDPAAFVDRRNPEPYIFTPAAPEPVELLIESEPPALIALPEFPELPDYRVDNYVGVQPYHLEIWCEKSTQNDILKPFCEQLGINLVTGLGELSITSANAVVERVRMCAKPARIFYVSDFDPAGLSMPVSVARKIEYFIRDGGLAGDVDVRLFPLLLTAAQVRQYRLPRTPIKETEKRRGEFELRHGTGAVELDALEALRPGELQRILLGAVEHYLDLSLVGRVRQAEAEYLGELEAIRQAIIDGHEDEIESLHAEYTQIKSEFEARLMNWQLRATEVWGTVSRELSEQAEEPESFPIPPAVDGREIGPGLLDTERGYFEQLNAYKQFQGKEGGGADLLDEEDDDLSLSM